MNIFSFLTLASLYQAYNLSRDHKPDLEVEKERILKAGGFIHAGRVNGSLNLARAIGTYQDTTEDMLMLAYLHLQLPTNTPLMMYVEAYFFFGLHQGRS